MKKFLDNEVTFYLSALVLGISGFFFCWMAGNYILGTELFEFCGVRFAGNLSSNARAVLSILLLVVIITSFALVIRSVGHYRGGEKRELGFLNKIPIELFITVTALVFIGCFFIFIECFRNAWWLYEKQLDMVAGVNDEAVYLSARGGIPFEVFLVSYAGMYISAIASVATVAARLKCHTLISGSLTRIVIKQCWKITVAVWKRIMGFFGYWIGFIRQFLKSLPSMYRSAVIAGFLYLLLLSCFLGSRYDNPLAFMFLLTLVVGVLYYFWVRFCWGYDKIRAAIQRISEGDTAYKTDTMYMTKSMMEQASNLNNIGRAVEAAAEKQVRSERLKAELITNVSHDIKTPLTSIISYIDLLGKEELDNRQAREYVAVLEKQSVRLKKLLEDVVEASKASTGNITANFERINLATRLGQAVGEYSDKAAARGVEFDVTIEDEEAYVYSDGRLLWRIFDNLLGNACKYSMPGTRVYIICHRVGERHIITFKNISKSKLNISPDELMERFVRGDSSRNTEGSGLGLSIAQSLSSILHGELSLSIDGDLFKASLSLEAI